MFVLIRKEALENLLTMRFYLGLAVCLVLFAIATVVFIGDFLYEQETALSTIKENENRITAWSVYNEVRPYAVRPPSAVSIYSSKANDQWGNVLQVSVSRIPAIPEDDASGSTTDMRSFFKDLDFSLIVQVFISLLAFLFTFDAVSGEKERASLRLMLSNPVSRSSIIIAKFFGALAALSLIIVAGFLVSAIIISFSAVSFGFSEWLGFTAILALAIIFAGVIAAMGIFFSSLFHSSSVSLTAVLIAWVALILVYPNAVTALMPHGQVTHVREQLQQDMDNLQDEYDQAFQLFEIDLHTDYNAMFYFSHEGSGADNVLLYRFMGKNAQNNLTREIPKYVDGLRRFAIQRYDAEMRYLKARRQQLETVRTMQRLSPGIIFADASAALANNDTDAYWHFLESAKTYRQELMEYLEGRSAFSTLRFVSDDYEGMPASDILAKLETMTVQEQNQWVQANYQTLIDTVYPLLQNIENDEKRKLNLSDMPRYQFDPKPLEEKLVNASPEVLILVLQILVFLSLAVVRFNSYDVR